jgi:hypothetical protein
MAAVHTRSQESLKAQLTAKLELAKFLQDTTEEMAKMLSSKRTGDVQARTHHRARAVCPPCQLTDASAHCSHRRRRRSCTTS